MQIEISSQEKKSHMIINFLWKQTKYPVYVVVNIARERKYIHNIYNTKETWLIFNT